MTDNAFRTEIKDKFTKLRNFKLLNDGSVAVSCSASGSLSHGARCNFDYYQIPVAHLNPETR